jgi:hypothetical protein
MGRWLALAAAALLVAPTAPRCQDGATRLSPCLVTTEDVERHAMIFHGHPKPRLLTSELTISGIDPRDVQRTLQDYNRRSEVAQISRNSVVLAPYLLQRAFAMDPDQLLQVRLTARTACLVFQLTWR